MVQRRIIEFNEGWEYIQKGIRKLKRILEGLREPPFSSEEYMALHITIYNMCSQNIPNNNSGTSGFNEFGLACFRDLVYDALKHKAKDAVIDEREREQVDRALLANVLDIFVVMGKGESSYYSRISTNWVLKDPCPDYMRKAEECLKKERDRVSRYLQSNGEEKLVEKVQHELLVVYATQLLEKEQSGCGALFRGNKVDDLSRMLGTVADAFRQHVTAAGTVLVQQAEDAAKNKQEQKVVKVLVYISDKDLFAEFYRKKLARRLLFDRSRTLARKSQTGFEKYLRYNKNAHAGIDLSVTVLATGFWPSYKSSDLNRPSQMIKCIEMIKCVEVFKRFYETKTKHRKLSWIYSLGQCHINAKFELKNIELIISTYQAAILDLFNASNRLSYSQVITQLNLTHDDLVRLLHSLSILDYKILIKEPDTKSISRSDYFELNSKFTDRMRGSRSLSHHRKVLGHQQLVSECVELLGRMFKPAVKAFKKRIEGLISQDYLGRYPENPNTFKCLA
ncbi:hypothetical protein CICLE_v10018125mg [Citrus x clementina]|uniref:Cullin family profile domain-containing protein n=1 Tax=Citrus clementina TaxID=85681 RepID=V4W5R6_CITCL|nr:hypothetical protein CICLE_v10018125mg [Citrus x clementina]